MKKRLAWLLVEPCKRHGPKQAGLRVKTMVS